MISTKLGYRCLYVTIIPDGDRLGHACCQDPLIEGNDDKIEHALKVLIAAGLAEGRHFGSPTWGDADDRVKAKNLALFATDRDNHLLVKVSTDGILTVVAGNGIRGFSGDGGGATSASLNLPTAVAVDMAGNLYIADYANDRVRKVSANGIITTVAGNGVRGFSGDGAIGGGAC